MFDLVPLAGTWRRVTDDEGQPRLVGQLLQRRLPQSLGYKSPETFETEYAPVPAA
jgi:hypothetical protein